MWRSNDGINWTRVVSQGFGRLTNAAVNRFAVFNNTLYASTWSYTTTQGLEIWRSNTGSSASWTKVVDNGFNNPSNETVLSFEVFNGYLYASTYNYYSATGGGVWRTSTGDAGSWEQVNPGGFGIANTNQAVSALAAFNGYLYASTTGKTGYGSQVWRCQTCDGSDWTKVVDNGFGNSETRGMNALEVFSGQLYFVVGNRITGLEVWRTANGTDWEQIGFAGFGNSNNRETGWDNSTVVFNNNFYVGTLNTTDGGEVWMLIHKIFLPLVLRAYPKNGYNWVQEVSQ